MSPNPVANPLSGPPAPAPSSAPAAGPTAPPVVPPPPAPAAPTERVLVLRAADEAALSAVRHLPALRAARLAEAIWLRGLPPTGALPLALRQLPAAAAYALDAAGHLFAAGARTPTAALPALPWRPLRELLPLTLPTAALPGQPPPPHPLRLVPAAHAEAGAALLTTWAAWAAYADTAPEARLRGLRFAVSARGQALLLGAPLPPVPGQELWLCAGSLLPAGVAFESPLLFELVAEKLNPAGDALLLFDANGAWERIAQAQLVPASRSAVRLTAGEIPRGPSRDPYGAGPIGVS